MKNKILVYVPYDFSLPSKGSSVRPYYLTRELKKISKIVLISGSIAEKRAGVKKIKKNWSLGGSVDMVYVESMNHPFRPFELAFFVWLRLKGVPMGIFIRDIHWFFPDHFLNKNIRQKIKRQRQFFQYWLLKRLFSISFSPSKEFIPYFKKMGFKKIVLLPPGGLVKNKVRGSFSSKTIIYVGGVGGDRGEAFLVDSFKILKRKIPELRVKIIGNESPDCLDEHREIDGVEIYTNLSSKELSKHYRQSSVATIPLLPNPFYEIARTIKVYEYMSYGLPVVTTPRKETASVVRDECIGEVSGDTAEEFAKSIEKIITNKEIYKKYSQNGLDSVKSRNSWAHRANKIIEVLSESIEK